MAEGCCMIDERAYQTRMVAQIQRRFAEGVRSILGVLPTGGGKTEVAMIVIDQMPADAGRVLIVTERKSLCTQWVARLRRHGVRRYIGVIQADNTRMTNAPLLVATTQ